MPATLPSPKRVRQILPHLAVSYIKRALKDAQESIAEGNLDALREALEDATDCAAYLSPADLKSQIRKSHIPSDS